MKKADKLIAKHSLKPETEERFRLFRERKVADAKSRASRILERLAQKQKQKKARRFGPQHKSPHHESLLERGFVPGTPEWRKELDRISHRKKYERDKLKPDYKERLRARQKKSYWRNVDARRARDRERGAKRRAACKDWINALARKRYRDDPEAATKQNERRYKREPHKLIRAAARDLAKGILDGPESLNRIDRAIAYADERSLKETRKRSAKTRYRESGASSSEHEHAGKTDSNES